MPSIRRLATLVSLAGTALLAAACTSPYAGSYRDMSGTTMANVPFETYAGPPRLVESAGDPKLDVFLQLDNGYAVIGASPVFGDARNPEEVLAEARQVSAAVVIVGKKFSGPPDPSYLRYGVEPMEQWALYFAPLPRKGTGLLFDRMTPQQEREAGTARGLRVIAVRKGSPGARTDIILGDVILTLDGREVTDASSLRQAVASAGGRVAAVELVRDGKRFATSIDLRGW